MCIDSTVRGCSNKCRDLDKGCAVKKPGEFHFHPSQTFHLFSLVDKPEHQYVCLWHVPIPMCFPSKPDTSSVFILVSLLPFSLTAYWLCSASHGSIHSTGVHEVVLGRCVRSSSFIVPKINLRFALSSLAADLSPRSSRDISFSSRDERSEAFTEFRPVQWEGNSVVEKNEKATCYTDLLSWF